MRTRSASGPSGSRAVSPPTRRARPSGRARRRARPGRGEQRRPALAEDLLQARSARRSSAGGQVDVVVPADEHRRPRRRPGRPAAGVRGGAGHQDPCDGTASRSPGASEPAARPRRSGGRRPAERRCAAGPTAESSADRPVALRRRRPVPTSTTSASARSVRNTRWSPGEPSLAARRDGDRAVQGGDEVTRTRGRAAAGRPRPGRRRRSVARVGQQAAHVSGW